MPEQTVSIELTERQALIALYHLAHVRVIHCPEDQVRDHRAVILNLKAILGITDPDCDWDGEMDKRLAAI